MINAYATFEAGAELKPFEYDPGPLEPVIRPGKKGAYSSYPPACDGC